MSLSELRNNKFVRFVSNKYVLILVVFIIWMLFFDANSYLTHHELDSEINALEDNAEFYQKEIENDKAFINAVNQLQTEYNSLITDIESRLSRDASGNIVVATGYGSH